MTFSGYVSPCSAVLDRCDVALPLSVRDALGNVVVEGQLAERPVVATAAAATSRASSTAPPGSTCPPTTREAVADAVARLVADPARPGAMAPRRPRVRPRLFGTGRYGERVVDTLVQLTR